MSQEWSRKEDAGEWPKSKHAWAIRTLLIAIVAVASICAYRYTYVLTPLQHFYLTTYARCGLRSVINLSRTDRYLMLNVEDGKGTRLALDEEVVPVTTANGEKTFGLTDEAVRAGDKRLVFQQVRYDNAKLHEFLGYWIYRDQTFTDFLLPALWGGLGVLCLGLLPALSKDAIHSHEQKHGRRLRGPDNESRNEINQIIHREMQARGQVDHREYAVRTLVARQEITGADRQWAGQHELGDVVRYTRGSKVHGIEAGEYAGVEHVNVKNNQVTLKRRNGQQVSYDPRRLHGVTVYREAVRAFSKGDRVQFTAPNREQRIPNRELGTIEKIDDSGNLRLRVDSGRTIAFNIKENAHLDYGYAMTSHNSQGQTADRVLIHVDTEHASEKLVNRRLAYVAVSRGRCDAQIYTNDKAHLTEQLSRDVFHQSALELNHELRPRQNHIQHSSAQTQAHQHTRGPGYSISR